jgi:copper chaperone CopZ
LHQRLPRLVRFLCAPDDHASATKARRNREETAASGGVRPGLGEIGPRARGFPISAVFVVLRLRNRRKPGKMRATGGFAVTELTILMPCLNEAETIETCIRKAKGYLERSGISGEVVIADNGSTDGSQAMAEALGARVVDVPVKGYGAALGRRDRRGAWALRHHG